MERQDSSLYPLAQPNQKAPKCGCLLHLLLVAKLERCDVRLWVRRAARWEAFANAPGGWRSERKSVQWPKSHKRWLSDATNRRVAITRMEWAWWSNAPSGWWSEATNGQNNERLRCDYVLDRAMKSPPHTHKLCWEKTHCHKILKYIKSRDIMHLQGRRNVVLSGFWFFRRNMI